MVALTSDIRDVGCGRLDIRDVSCGRPDIRDIGCCRLDIRMLVLAVLENLSLITDL